MATFVLVHGSFHGGWCWKKIAPKLRANSHTVYTPTMTGLGDRSHLAHPRAGLNLNIDDVVQQIEYEDLEEIILVGHSYGGLVISGVAEKCAERIAHMVYLDGYLPDHDQSAWDITPDVKEPWEDAAESAGNGWLVPPVDPAETYGVTDPADVQWLREKMEPTPLLTHQEPLRTPDERAKDLPRTYIRCRRYDAFREMARKAKRNGLRYHELDTGHDAMVTSPNELSSLLLDVAPGET